MTPLPLRAAAVAALLVLAAPARAESSPLLPAEKVPLWSFGAFQLPAANWQVGGELTGDPRREKILTQKDGTGVILSNPTKAAHGHLLTAWEHGDVELDLEFLLPPRSNSGVYLQGRYEVQLLDSWGVRTPGPDDCGGLYSRWADARGKGHEEFDGPAPRANACRAPGLWQQLHIEFEAPRFDAAGRKIKNARFVRVVLNGFLIHEDAEVTGPTRSAAFDDEKPLGPLMIQGDHGAVALRKIFVKRFDPAAARATVSGLAYKLYPGGHAAIGSYDAITPKSTGAAETLSPAAIEKTGTYALVFTGTLTVPRAGTYAFAATTSGAARLLVDGQPVLDPADQPGTTTLTAGRHEFRLDFLRSRPSRKPALALTIEGPGLARQLLTLPEPPAKE